MGVFLKNLFLDVLNMSITASYVILFILLARLFLKKVPKIFSYSLWAVVLFRLICPISFSSAFSLLGLFKKDSTKFIPGDISLFTNPQGNGGTYVIPKQSISSLTDVNQIISGNPIANTNPMETALFIISLIWALGVLSLIIYSIVSYVLLKRKISTAMLLDSKVYECENITSPFVLGIIKPKIYLPIALQENQRDYIIRHEETHIKRLDYLVKPFAFLVLCIHWFNPLVWISFLLMNKDMEMSCDEHVLKKMGMEIKKAYSSSLLSLAVDRKIIGASPLAFGESNTKSRIKNVLNYRKPVFWAVILGALAIAAISIGLMANPKNDGSKLSFSYKDGTDLAFLNINKTVSAALQKVSLLTGENGRGGTYIRGGVFGGWLEKSAVDWKAVNLPPSYEPSQATSVYINIATGHEVRFFHSEPELAMILYDGEYEYYKIPKDALYEISMMSAISSFYIPGEVMDAITGGIRTNKKSLQDIPNEGDCIELKMGNESYYIYEEDGKYYFEEPYQYINEITEEAYIATAGFAGVKIEGKKPEVSSEIVAIVEDSLTAIMSSPLESSNPEDYIKANQNAYESILKYGGEEGLSYMLSQFREGNTEGLRGQIMMRLCKELLGQRNNVMDDTLSPKEWFSQLSIRQEIELPDFVYSGDDPIESLVYETEVQKHRSSRIGFTIVASHIFGSYEEGNKLKVFVTTYGSSYILYDKTLEKDGGGIFPVAITYTKNPDGSYILEKYEQAEDGSYFGPSIKEFCVMPLSGKKISGLSKKILSHYGDYEDIIKLERENLIKHLKANNQNGVSLYQERYKEPAELIPLTYDM